MKRAHIISHIATLGLVITLLSLSGFALWVATVTQNTAREARDATLVSNLYEEARLEFLQEAVLIHDYYMSPSQDIQVQYREVSDNFIYHLRFLQTTKNVEDGRHISFILDKQREYNDIVQQLFWLIDTRDTKAASRLNEQEDVIREQIETLLDQEVNDHRNQATQALNQLNNAQNRSMMITPVVFSIGFLLVCVCWVVLYIYRQRVQAAAVAEMARLTQHALRDNLTDLGNHRAFQEDMQCLFASNTANEQKIVLALINIDELKVINDRFGHLYGDDILTEFAQLLRESRHTPYMYRLGGDEFALLLTNVSLGEAQVAMEHLRQGAAQRLLNATISIGLASLIEGEEKVDILQRQADAALREAKRRSRNTVVTYEEISDATPLLSSKKVLALHRLLSEKKLTIAFQPIWDLQRGEILSFEALTRPAADYGFSGPQEAFDIAEKLGYAHQLDYICLQAILQRASELPPNTLLFINITPQSLDHDLLTGAVLMQAVVAAGLTPQRIVLEITERSVSSLPVIIREGKQLRNLGFQLALDDTGAGNAGLEMLSQFRVDFVKIDRSVVVKALTDRTARGVLSGIKTIAHEVEAYIIAEGIENTEMLTLVRELGIQGVQGYLLGRPSEVIPDTRELQTLLAGEAGQVAKEF